MQAVQGSITVPVGKILVFSIPLRQLHNIAIKAAGNISLGGPEVEATSGLGMAAGDVAAWSWQDFRNNDSGNLEIYAAAAVETTLSFLVWKK